MRNLSIRQRLLITTIVSVVLLALVGALILTRLARIDSEAVSLETDSIPQLKYSQEITVSISSNYALLQQYLVMHDSGRSNPAILDRLNGSRSQIMQSVTEFENTSLNGDDRVQLTALKDALRSYISSEEQLIVQVEADAHGEAQNIRADRLGPDPGAAYVALLVISNSNHDEAAASTKQIASDLWTTIVTFAIALAAGICAALWMGYATWRSVAQPLGRFLGSFVEATENIRQGDFTKRLAVDRQDEIGILASGFNHMMDELVGLIGQVQIFGIQVHTSITELAATSKQQQATATEIAATTVEVGATSREISTTSKELVRTMTDVSLVADRTAALAGTGQAGVSRMGDTMRRVVDAMGSINAKLVVLSEKAGNINQVVTTITKVADQTNLLSLNAAIEAEKAGEYGRGFSVVATEIRRLADQTAVASYDIEQTVKEIQSAVSAGVMGMDKFSEEVRRGMQDVQEVGGQLSQIIEQVQALAPQVEEANEAMNVQASGAGQISEALAQLGEAARQTVESLSQSTVAIDDLNHVSGSLRTSISRFKVDARGATRAAV